MSAELASRSSVSTDVSYFKSTISQNITSGVATLSFDMKPYTRNGAPITKGEISVTLTLAGGAKSDMARAILKDSSGQVKDSRTYGENGPLESSSTITYTKSGLNEGTYDLEIEFYSIDENAGEIRQNSWKALARVVPGLIAQAEVKDFNLNEVYHITYENVEDATLAAGQVLIKSFSRKSNEITLAEYEKNGFYFMGWYEDDSFPAASTAITVVDPKTTTTNKSLYALCNRRNFGYSHPARISLEHSHITLIIRYRHPRHRRTAKRYSQWK